MVDKNKVTDSLWTHTIWLKKLFMLDGSSFSFQISMYKMARILQIKTSYKNKTFVRQKRPSSNIQLSCSCVSYFLVFLLLPHIHWFTIWKWPNMKKLVMLRNHWERLSPGLLILESSLLLIFLLTSFLKRSSSLMWP